MNVNWKEAILQAQKKIDQVLDIRPESVEVEVEEEPEPQEDVIDQNCSSPSQSSEVLGDDIVMLEPVLPRKFMLLKKFVKKGFIFSFFEQSIHWWWYSNNNFLGYWTFDKVGVWFFNFSDKN